MFTIGAFVDPAVAILRPTRQSLPVHQDAAIAISVQYRVQPVACLVNVGIVAFATQEHVIALAALQHIVACVAHQ